MMAFTHDYTSEEPSLGQVERLSGATVLEFGNSWCGYCRQAESLIKAAFTKYGSVEHIRIADASGRPLGRSFKVKLWPTLIFLRDGREISRLIRCYDPETIEKAFAELESGR